MADLNKKERELIRLYALGEALDSQDSLQFQQIMEHSAGAKEELSNHLKFKELMSQGKAHAVHPDFIDETMNRISNISPTPDPPTPSVVRKFSGSIAWVWHPTYTPRLAFAAFVLVMFVGHLILIRPKTFTVPPGEQRTVLLADHSEVTISSGSTLRVFPSYVRSKRKVVLEGEAYFDVEPGKKPFVVKTFNSVVTVKGTEFNVRSHPNRADQKTVVSVYEGLVDVASPTIPNQVVSLEQGEGTQVVGSSSAPDAKETVAIEQVLAWKSGGFAFEDEPMIVVLDEFERRFDLSLTASPELLRLKVSFYQPTSAPVTEVLEAICESLNLQYRKTAQGYEVLALD